MSANENDLEAEIFGNSDDSSDWSEEEHEPEKSEKDKKRRASPSAAKKSKKSRVGDTNDGDDDDDDDDDGPSRPQTSFEREMEKMKNRERAMRKEMNDTEVSAETDEKVVAFIKRMDDAMHSDRDCSKNDKPALSVLNMLDVTYRTLSKRNLQETFVSQGVLSVLANWMMPYENGTAPHFSVRTTVLKIVDQLSIDSVQLKDSGLGQITAKVKKDKKELKSNRRMAQALIEKWCRQIFPTATSDYISYSAEERCQDALDRERGIREQLRAEKVKSKSNEVDETKRADALSGAIAGSSQSSQKTPKAKSKKKDREALLSKRARVPQANMNTYSVPPPIEEGVQDRLSVMRTTMSSGDRKIKSVRESRGKASKARVVGMKIVGV